MKSGIYFALEMAFRAQAQGEVPVGAVIIDDQTGQVFARAHNETELRGHPLAHAEMLVIEQACAAKKTRYLSDCSLYVTLEPCPMCAQAISMAHISKIYYGADDPKSGGVVSGARVYEATSAHHKPIVKAGLQSHAAADLLHHFFLDRRG